MFELILASKSKARAKTLKNANIKFRIKKIELDEQKIVSSLEGKSFKAIVKELAYRKNMKVKRSKNDFVLTCDSMFEFENELIGKPRTKQQAFANIKKYKNNFGILHTGYSLTHNNKTVNRVCSTKVYFGNIYDKEIREYIKTGEPLRVAGGFTIDALGAPFIEKIIGDYHNVVGLSLNTLNKMLEHFNVSITDFWSKRSK